MGARILWISLTFWDKKQRMQIVAFVDESYEMITPVFDPVENTYPVCTTIDAIPAQPRCWKDLLKRAQDLGGRLGVFAR